MKYIFFILSFFVSITFSFSQGFILSSTLGSNGNSKHIKTTNGNYYVSESINQTSVIGTFSKKNYTIRQGFQQPLSGVKFSFINNLKAKVYPNPFSQSIYISFSEVISNPIYITISDMSGRNLKSLKYIASQKIELPLDTFSSGIYILKVTTKNKQFITNLLKK